MTRTYIPRALRDRIAAQSRHRCGYCLTASAVVGEPLVIDHILPLSLGGKSEEENLWLACSLCNNYKGNQVAALDPLSGILVPLFNPRQQVWTNHFAWTIEADLLVGLTPIGRATVMALSLNRPSLVTARRLWASVGWHPPRD